ncbi:hypothetical protein HID58_002194 [Brassica napus]|uniref:Uncharacterized protein n=1 Tax=Brassica napus TaxID=3708 RepID=A0ABQ8ELK2_BRANA|nr:hypothetical protein HID58_002194 [Brassica napus]
MPTPPQISRSQTLHGSSIRVSSREQGNKVSAEIRVCGCRKNKGINVVYRSNWLGYSYHFAGPVLSKRYGLHFLFMPLSFVVSLNKQASVKRGQSKGKKKSERESTELTL